MVTGEEGEKTYHNVRGKLFVLTDQNQWKERGTGMLRLNANKEDDTAPRLCMPLTLSLYLHMLMPSCAVVMRKDAVYTVILNAPLFRGMSCTIAQDPRYIRFSLIESGTMTHYNIRVRLSL